MFTARYELNYCVCVYIYIYIKLVVPCIVIQCEYKFNQMQQYADIYLLQSYSICFGCHSTHHQAY